MGKEGGGICKTSLPLSGFQTNLDLFLSASFQNMNQPAFTDN